MKLLWYAKMKEWEYLLTVHSKGKLMTLVVVTLIYTCTTNLLPLTNASFWNGILLEYTG